MTCDEYLSILAATPVGALRPSRLPEHAATCPHCQRATRLVMEREGNLVGLDEDLFSYAPSVVPPAAALTASRHRYVDRMYRLGVGILIAATFAFVAAKWVVIRTPADPEAIAATMAEQAFLVQCLSAPEVGALVRPLLAPAGMMTYTGGPGRGVVTVRGTPAELRAVNAAFERAEQQGRYACTGGTPPSASR